MNYIDSSKNKSIKVLNLCVCLVVTELSRNWYNLLYTFLQVRDYLFGEENEISFESIRLPEAELLVHFEYPNLKSFQI